MGKDWGRIFVFRSAHFLNIQALGYPLFAFLMTNGACMCLFYSDSRFDLLSHG